MKTTTQSFAVGDTYKTPNYATVEIKQYGEKTYKVAGGFWFYPATNDGAIDAILAAHRTGGRVRIYCGNVETGEDWGERYDITGTIGRSMGPVKIPLLIHNSRSMGGGGIGTDCIVKMRYNSGGKEMLYKHPTYSHGNYTVEPETNQATRDKGYLYCVTRNGERVYGCKTESDAKKEIAFLTA